MNASGPRWVVVVECDRSGQFYLPEVRRRGLASLHVRLGRADEVPDDAFDRVLVVESLDEAARGLCELDVRCVVAGSETGVEGADHLAEALGLPGNGAGSSAARRDKFEMVEAVRRAGLRAARQRRAASAGEVRDWMAAEGLDEVVVKPSRSAGTDRVACCDAGPGLDAAVAAIAGATNRLGVAERDVVAQERLDGEEYFVNAVSCDGRHHVTDIWRSPKRALHGCPFAYDLFELRPCTDPIGAGLTAYVHRVLDALGVRHGPSHTEVRWTRDGPALIESGARLDGLLLPEVNARCIGYGPVDLALDALLDPAAFRERASRPYTLRTHAATVVLTSYSSGVLAGDVAIDLLRALPSFHLLRIRYGRGDVVPLTTDAFTMPGVVTLLHADRGAILGDYAAIRQMEADGLLLDVIPHLRPLRAGPGRRARELTARLAHREELRQSPAWSAALDSLGWRTFRAGGARCRALGSGVVVDRPAELDLAALDRECAERGVEHVVLRPAPQMTLRPVGEPPASLSFGPVLTDADLAELGRYGLGRASDPAAETRVLALDLTDPKTLSAAARSAQGIARGGVVIADALAPETAPRVAVAFAGSGSGAEAAAVARAFVGASWLVVAHRGTGVLGAALLLVHDRVAHVPYLHVASGPDAAASIRALVGAAAGVACTRRCDVALLGSTPDERLEGPVPRDPTERALAALRPIGVYFPPSLAYYRPPWAEGLSPREPLDALAGGPPAARPAPSGLVDRFLAREPLLQTPAGAAGLMRLGYEIVATGGGPMAVLPSGEGLLLLSRAVNLDELREVMRAQRLDAIRVEPHPTLTIGDEALVFDVARPATFFEQAARHGLRPSSRRWLHRKTLLVDLTGESWTDRLQPRLRRQLRTALRSDLGVSVTAARDADRQTWRDVYVINNAWRGATGLPDSLPFTAAVLEALPEASAIAVLRDAGGPVAYQLCAAHDGNAYALAAAVHPRARAPGLSTVALYHAASLCITQGCDVLDLHGAFDERFPGEHLEWRGFTEHKQRMRPSAVYYPPTLQFE